jgi:two-component system, cell cycle response regulator
VRRPDPGADTIGDELDDPTTEQTSAMVRPKGREARRVVVVRVTSGADEMAYAVLDPARGVLIGRDASADLQLGDAGASRRHAYVSVVDHGVRLTDLGSTNGTWRDGVRIAGAVSLAFGDRFEIGKLTLICERLSEQELGLLQRVQKRLDTANVDPLTGVFTRAWADEALPAIVTDHDQGRMPIAALFLDADRFKQVNDTYGHAAGDAVLRVIARTAASGIRTTDSMVRWGGEEFVVFLFNCPAPPALEIAERIRSRIEEYDWSGLQLGPGVTVSIGVAQRTTGEPLADWLARADAALYAAKAGGRNRTVLAQLSPRSSPVR